MTGDEEVYLDVLYSDYREAIKAGQVEDALLLGDLYFNTLRDGKITYEDREQLQTDVMLCASIRDNLKE